MKISSFSSIIAIISLFCLISIVKSDPDPNFYIFLSFGQSNMQGQGDIEEQDKTCPERFKMMAAIDMPETGRSKFNWYTATPPLCRDGTKLSPADYFGRTMVEKLPEKIRVGIINVSFSGCKIELFDEDLKDAYLKTVTEDWFLWGVYSAYQNNPYRVLVTAAKQAQYDGVIKGILLHQGESNEGEPDWPVKLKKIYDNMLKELELNEKDVPLLVGEVVTSEFHGVCSAHNRIIAKVPEYISNAHVISAAGLEPKDDRTHFTSNSYRIFGKRYAEKMIELLNKKNDKENLEEKSNTGLIIFIVILIIVIVAAVGYFLYKRHLGKNSNGLTADSPLFSK